MTIGVAIIAKNEEKMLGQCLDSIKELDGIWLADTGSEDSTIEIAKKFTQNVYTEFKWNDRFCDARNFIKSKVTTDWILSIDCDEVLYDVEAVKEAVVLAEQQKALAVDVTLIADNNGQWFYYPRLFKNVPEVFWEGAIHNTLSVVGERLGNVRIKVGYSPAHLKDPRRALRILEKDIKERFSPRSMFYLGREYWYVKEYEKAVQTLGKYVVSSRFLAEKADAFLIMARCYWAMKMPDDARDACVQSLIINPNFKEAVLFMATLAGDGTGNPRWENNARQWKEMAKTADNNDVLFVRTDI